MVPTETGELWKTALAPVFAESAAASSKPSSVILIDGRTDWPMSSRASSTPSPASRAEPPQAAIGLGRIEGIWRQPAAEHRPFQLARLIGP